MPQQNINRSNYIALDDLPVRMAGDEARMGSLISQIPLELPKGEYLVKLEGKEVHISRTDSDLDMFQSTSTALGQQRFKPGGSIELTSTGTSYEKVILHVTKHPLTADEKKLPLLSSDSRLVAAEMSELAKLAPKLKDGTASIEEIQAAEQLVKRIHNTFAQKPELKKKTAKPAVEEEPAYVPPPPPAPKPTPRSSSSSTGYSPSSYNYGGG